jgi:membrane protease subunit HflK
LNVIANTSWIDYQAGVQIAAVQFQDVDPPEAVAAAFKDVTNAKEDREKLINQSHRAIATIFTPKAKGEAAQLVNQAKGLCAGAAQSRAGRIQPIPRDTERIQPGKRHYQQADLYRDP